jgi:excisionase family DNA binding protein
VNLKTAARRLGVHYQTAYRWVRGGELVAVKVGAGYEISEAALDRSEAQRTALERVPDLTSSRAVAPRAACTRDSALEMLDGMIAAITLDAEPVVERAVRIAADVLGDGAVITLRSCDDEFSDVRVAHCDAVTELTLATVARHAPFTKDFARMVARTGRPVFVPQVPQRDVRSSVQAEQHEHLVNGACFSLICVPVGIGDHTEGAFLLARDQPGRLMNTTTSRSRKHSHRVARARLLARRY